jgi:hypothetical protein
VSTALSTLRVASSGALLDDLLASRFLSRQWPYRVRTAGELPARLQHCAINLAPSAEWRAYADEDRVLFAVARAHSGESPSPSSETAVDVYFLDGNAAVYSAGVWAHDGKHGWWLDSVLDLCYDCDRGWWLDALFKDCAPRDETETAGGRRELRRVNHGSLLRKSQ